MSVRSSIVNWATWGVAHHDQFTYSEGPDRMEAIKTPPGTLPVTADCSAFVTLCFKWAGAPDPNGLGYDGEGYTGTLLEHLEHIPLEQVQPGDIIVYGAAPGEHTAIVVVAGPDPMTVSHGQQGDPNFVRVSQDGRQPQTYLRGVPADPPPQPKRPTIHIGSRGGWVNKAQIALKQPETGFFGPRLLAATVNFQRAHRILPTGVIGPSTWNALGVS